MVNVTKRVNDKARLKIEKITAHDIFFNNVQRDKKLWDIRCLSTIPLTLENINLLEQLLAENRADFKEALEGYNWF